MYIYENDQLPTGAEGGIDRAIGDERYGVRGMERVPEADARGEQRCVAHVVRVYSDRHVSGDSFRPRRPHEHRVRRF